MKRDDLERYLDRGDHLGFRMNTNSDNYLGWILLEKVKPNIRLLELHVPDEDQHFISQQEFIRRNPYKVTVMELRRDVHESDLYETEEDYRKKDYYYFSDLIQVENFINDLDYSLEQIKWRSELDAP